MVKQKTLSCHSKNPCISARVRVEIDPKKLSKIGPKWYPKGARGTPGASWGPVRAGFQAQLQLGSKIDGFWEAPRMPRQAPGNERDPQNRLKIEFFLKEVVPNVDS